MPVWDIAARPAREQFGYWHEVICQAFVPLTPYRTADAPGFAARVETRELGAVTRAAIRSQPQRTVHGPREVRRSEGAFYFVNLQLAGRCLVEQGGTESVVAPGSFTVVDTTEPYRFAFDDEWRMLSFRVPRELLSARLPDPRRGTGAAVDGSGGVGGVVSALMRSLWELDGTGAAEAAAVAELEGSFAAVVAVAMGAAAPPQDASVHDATRAAVLRHVLAHLSDPDLSVATVCRRFAISPRLLHALFAREERSFAETVRALRLDRCAQLLADPRTTAGVTDIAARHGFTDPSSFARAFRRRFGASPREVRARGAHPDPVPARRATGPRAAAAQARNVADGS